MQKFCCLVLRLVHVKLIIILNKFQKHLKHDKFRNMNIHWTVHCAVLKHACNDWTWELWGDMLHCASMKPVINEWTWELWGDMLHCAVMKPVSNDWTWELWGDMLHCAVMKPVINCNSVTIVNKWHNANDDLWCWPIWFIIQNKSCKITTTIY